MSATEKGSKPGLFQRAKRFVNKSPRQLKLAETDSSEKGDQTACSTPGEICIKDDEHCSNEALAPSDQQEDGAVKQSKNGPSTDEEGNTYPEGGARAWIVTFGCYCGMFAAFGVMNTIGIFNSYISTHQLKEYDESTISWIFSIYIFLVFFCGLQIGPIFDARGPRMLMIVGSGFLVTSIFTLGVCTGRSFPLVRLPLPITITTTTPFSTPNSTH